MPSFLQQVAYYYHDQQHLEDFCFVFPNRRSGQFFEKELRAHYQSPHFMPHVLTMAEWLDQISDRVLASTIDMVFTLYRAYCEAFGNAAQPFDRFIYWAHIILTDFNDVDMALADADKLYANLNDLRELATDYIDPKLKKEIGRIFNIQFTDSDTFWKNLHAASDDATAAVYFTLWEKLAEIYRGFHRMMGERGLITQGQLYRQMALRMESLSNHQLGCKQVVMVGFAALSVSEDKIFKSLQQRGIAHFWWDVSSPAFTRDNQGGELVRLFSERYPAPAPLQELQVDDTTQRIDVMAVPSGVGQAKWAFHLVDQMGTKTSERLPEMARLELPSINLENALNTAIVLPDECLFESLLTSVPPGVGRMNVTLGYPMRHSGIVSLMHLVARAHQQATKNSEGKKMFYREDVIDILSHPVVKAAFVDDVVKISTDIQLGHDYNVAEDIFDKSELRLLFTTINDVTDKNQILAYIDRLLNFIDRLDQRVRDIAPSASDDNNDNDDNINGDLLPLQSAFMLHYAQALRLLRKAFEEFRLSSIENTSIFYLIDRITAGIIIPFTGEPLEGLQIMGFLEAQCLDFDNVIILSANERVLPSRKTMSSFIPDMLRASHLMPTNAFNEAVTTYHFYRLLSRTKRVMLIYDSTTGGGISGEPSRYIAQLEMVYGRKLNRTAIDCPIDTAPEINIIVPKRPEMLAHYTAQDGRPPLSASAIKKYLKCQLLFYLRQVQHLPDDDDHSDFMDARTFGTVIHNTLQQLYYPDVDGKERQDSYDVTAEMIKHFKENQLTQTVVREVNRTYFHRLDDLDRPLRGDAFILLDTIKTYVNRVLDYDLEMIKTGGKIEVLECEVEHTIRLNLNGLEVNFTFIIDRLDRVGDVVRLIDYKTGKSDNTKFASVDELLSTKNTDRYALMQLLLYCNALYQLDSSFNKIQPMIYKLSKMSETGMMIGQKNNGNQIIYNQYVFTPDEEVNQHFMSAMHDLLTEMFNSGESFKQTQEKKNCDHCHFTDFCQRLVEKNKR